MGAIDSSPDGFRYYAQSAGNPRGVKEDKAKCAFEVWPTGRWPRPYQCERKRGQGPDGAYCKQHAKKVAR